MKNSNNNNNNSIVFAVCSGILLVIMAAILLMVIKPMKTGAAYLISYEIHYIDINTREDLIEPEKGLFDIGSENPLTIVPPEIDGYSVVYKEDEVIRHHSLVIHLSGEDKVRKGTSDVYYVEYIKDDEDYISNQNDTITEENKKTDFQIFMEVAAIVLVVDLFLVFMLAMINSSYSKPKNEGNDKTQSKKGGAL